MIDTFEFGQLPYLCLLLTTLIFFIDGTRFARPAFALSVIIGLACGRVVWTGAGWVLIATALAAVGWTGWRRTMADVLFLFVVVLLSDYRLPGFDNLRVFTDHRFAADSAPFSMYLNFDKVASGLLILLFRGRRPGTGIRLDVALKVLVALVVAILPLALLVGYVRLDPKLPAGAFVWAVNNLLFVCVAEEALYRGFILEAFADRARGLGLGVSAFAFGLAHYRSGVPMIGFATFAGLFYGFAYLKSRRIETSMLVHFGLNAIHFFAFSYPRLGG